MKQKILNFIKKEMVLSVAIMCAIVTCFFVPIDKEYLNYFDLNTLMSLFCMLAVVAGLKKTNVFGVKTVVLCIFCRKMQIILTILNDFTTDL